MKQMAHTAFVS